MIPLRVDDHDAIELRLKDRRIDLGVTESFVIGSTTVKVRRDTTENWNAKPTYIPDNCDIIVYTDYNTREDGTPLPAIKIGDGKAYCVDLPFVGDDIRDDLLAHISDTSIHTTPLEKLFWNNKLNVNDSQEVVENVLIFNRN